MNQRADLLTSNYPTRAEQRAELCLKGRWCFLTWPAQSFPKDTYLVIKIKEGQVQPGHKRQNKEVNCSLNKSMLSLLCLTRLCVLKWLLPSDVPGHSITHYMNIGGATFELFVFILRLNDTTHESWMPCYPIFWTSKPFPDGLLPLCMGDERSAWG